MEAKDTCDHCDINSVLPHVPEKQVVWCKRCMKEDYKLINDAGLMDTAGTVMIFAENDSTLDIGLPENILKLQAIPKRAFQKLAEPEIKAITTTVQVDPQQQFNAAWFDFYNSLDNLPGSQGH
jgi:hypothetical protein